MKPMRILLIFLVWASVSAKDFPNPFVFFNSLEIIDETVVIQCNDGIGKLPGGMTDTRENTIYAKVQVYRVGDLIRSQGGQHDCYWHIIEIKGNTAVLRFFGHIRGFGSQDQTLSTAGYQRPQPGTGNKGSGMRPHE